MYNIEVNKQRAKELVAQMTIEEQAGQLTYNAPAIPRLGVPAYNWWNEALHGVARGGTATIFPQAIGLAAIFDEKFLEEVADIIAQEGRAKYNHAAKRGDRDIYKGLTFWSPNVNIFRDPRWGRGHETYGEDPYLSARLGIAFIQGLQGKGEVMKSAACAKHYAVHSGPEAVRHEFNAVVSKKDLYETYLPAFEECVKEGQVEAIMGAYNCVDGEPCCGSYQLLQKILRDDWKFDGHVVSDCGALEDFYVRHHVTATAPESAALAIDAGCDLNCGNMYLHILQALEMGLVNEEHITRAAERLFTTRYKLGLFDNTALDDIPFEVIECREHLEKAQEAARKSIVMLKNNGILPLNKGEQKTIGVIGPNANSRRVLKGNYYGSSSRYITLLQGIQDEAGDQVRILYGKGCELKNDRTQGMSQAHDRLIEAITVAEHSDIAILCLGLDETLEGEAGDANNADASGDKGNLDFPLVQQQLMEKIAETGKPIILCNMTGSAMNLSFAQENFDAILQTWYVGAGGGKAVADILFGKTSPSGKLPVTFYEDVEQLPPFEDYTMKNRTYRYYTGKPLYPFGYGLNYGDVHCANLQLEEIKEGKEIKLSLDVENQSNIDVEDVIQIYLKADSIHEVENTRLCYFERVKLKGNEKKEIKISIPYERLSVVNDLGEKVIDFTKVRLFAGITQPDERSQELMNKSCLELEVLI